MTSALSHREIPLHPAAGQRGDQRVDQKKYIYDQSAPLRLVSSMIYVDPDRVARTAAVDFAHRLASYWQAVLGIELLGAYLIGSLAHGGFSRRYSDIDMALVTQAGLPRQGLNCVRTEAEALSADWGPKLSMFWTDRPFCLGRFPPLDRIDYLDHAVVLTERERVHPARPMLQEIRRYQSGKPFVSWTEHARHLTASQTLEPKDHKGYLRTRTLLYPGRFCYSWMTGCMGSNEDAVAFLRKSPPVRLDVSLITRALQCRQAAADPDPLFPARTTLSSQVDACAALLPGQNASL
jgi:hypothetical protein